MLSEEENSKHNKLKKTLCYLVISSFMRIIGVVSQLLFDTPFENNKNIPTPS